MNDDLHQECAVTGNTLIKNVLPDLPVTTKLVGIYGLRNRINGKWYIGQSWDIHWRWRQYKLFRCKRQPKIYNALIKYGFDGFEKIIIEHCIENQSVLDETETYWIKHYNSVDSGYNLTYGGHSSTHGVKMSEETKQKIRLTKIGKPSWNKGKPSPNKGVPWSEKVRNAHKSIKRKPQSNKGVPWSKARRDAYKPKIKTYKEKKSAEEKRKNRSKSITESWKVRDREKASKDQINAWKARSRTQCPEHIAKCVEARRLSREKKKLKSSIPFQPLTSLQSVST